MSEREVNTLLKQETEAVIKKYEGKFCKGRLSEPCLEECGAVHIDWSCTPYRLYIYRDRKKVYIDENTVCQETGYFDANYKALFDHDVVLFTSNDENADYICEVLITDKGVVIKKLIEGDESDWVFNLSGMDSNCLTGAVYIGNTVINNKGTVEKHVAKQVEKLVRASPATVTSLEHKALSIIDNMLTEFARSADEFYITAAEGAARILTAIRGVEK